MAGLLVGLVGGEIAATCGDGVVFVARVVGDFFYDVNEVRYMDGATSVGQLNLENGIMIVGRIDVDLEILTAVALHETVASLAYGLTAGVGLHEQLEVGVATDVLFYLDALSRIVGVALGGSSESVAAVLAALTDAGFLARGGNQVSLQDFDALAVFHGIECGERRVIDEILALDLERLGFAEEARDFGQQMIEFLLESAVVLDDAQVRMADPGVLGTMVERDGLLGRFAAGGVVGEGIELLCSVGGGHHVKYGIVAVAQHDVGDLERVKQMLVIGFAHVGLGVAGTAIADNQNLVVLGLSQVMLVVDFLVENLFEQKLLEREWVLEVGRIDAAGDDRGDFLVEQDGLPTDFGEIPLDGAEGGRFAGTGAAS